MELLSVLRGPPAALSNDANDFETGNTARPPRWQGSNPRSNDHKLGALYQLRHTIPNVYACVCFCARVVRARVFMCVREDYLGVHRSDGTIDRALTELHDDHQDAEHGGQPQAEIPQDALRRGV
jgi:hypothetical protein